MFEFLGQMNSIEFGYLWAFIWTWFYIIFSAYDDDKKNAKVNAKLDQLNIQIQDLEKKIESMNNWNWDIDKDLSELESKVDNWDMSEAKVD